MTETNNCPKCGAHPAKDAPGGLCAACLLQAGLDENQPSEGRIRASMPTPEELAGILPDLDILECIGAGGMGVVYRARQPKLDREVAVKILSPDVADSQDFADRFSREARALASLSHPNVVSVHDFGQAGDLCYIVMELVDGTSLRHVMQDGRLEPRQALSIVSTLCETLQYAHDRGVVHRDIKPENVLLAKDGEVKVVDFGLAKSLRTGRDSTVTARAMGTPAYMAPEQIEQPGTVDHRADIFSLGVVFYEMLTGELPLGRFAPPSQKVEIDVRLDEVVLRTLEKERERRYQQAIDVKTDIHAVESTDAPPPRRHDSGDSRRRGPFHWMLPVGGCLAILVIGFLFLSAAAQLAIPRLLDAVDRGKQKRTVVDLRTISDSVESYRVANGSYPESTSIKELRNLLVPAHAAALPLTDGWTRAFVVEGGKETFTIGSGGKDGGPLEIIGDGGDIEGFEDFDDAIVFVNGELIQGPDVRAPATQAVWLSVFGIGMAFFVVSGILLFVAIVLTIYWFRRTRRRRRS